MTIDASFIAEVNKKIDAVEPGWTRNFRFNVTSIDGRSDGFNIPPLRKISQVLDAAPLSAEEKEDLLKVMIDGKRIEVIWMEGDAAHKLGDFIYNSPPPTPAGMVMNVAPAFDSFDVLRDNPAAYRTLANLALSTLLLKSMPPRIAAPSPAAQTKATHRPLPPRQSSGV